MINGMKLKKISKLYNMEVWNIWKKLKKNKKKEKMNCWIISKKWKKIKVKKIIKNKLMRLMKKNIG